MLKLQYDLFSCVLHFSSRRSHTTCGFCPQRTAGEPNYEAAVVPQIMCCVPRAHTLLGFTVCKAATAQHSYSKLYSVFALHAVWGARVAAGEEVV